MKEKVFRRLLSRLEMHTPAFLRCIELQLLMDLTAGAFDRRPRQIWYMPADQALAVYARFTRKCMKEMPKDMDSHRLYRLSYQMGQKIRRTTGFTEESDLQRLICLLYRNIGIHMTWDSDRDITVSHCFFSRVYSPAHCAFISAMDSGIIAGIQNGGAVHFHDRITEGCGCCRAVYNRNLNRSPDPDLQIAPDSYIQPLTEEIKSQN